MGSLLLFLYRSFAAGRWEDPQIHCRIPLRIRTFDPRTCLRLLLGQLGAVPQTVV